MVLTALVGYVLGSRGELSLSVGLAAVLGTALSAFGANILNQWWEVERDRVERHQALRPVDRLGHARLLEQVLLAKLLHEQAVNMELADADDKVGEEFVARLIERIKEVKTTLIPHGLHTLKNEYPQMGGDFEVMHYSELLAELNLPPATANGNGVKATTIS